MRSRESAADENATAYFPLLDRVAAGHFDKASTDRDLHTLFVQTLQDDGHITDPETLSSFEFALSIHATAPRIEAHYQYYNSSIEPLLSTQSGGECESWAYFDGKQYCSPDLAGAEGKSIVQR